MDIDDTFDKFMRVVNPSVEQHSAQYRESRRVFFAGMWALLQHMLKVSYALPEEVAMRDVAHIEEQLLQFKKRASEDKD